MSLDFEIINNYPLVIKCNNKHYFLECETKNISPRIFKQHENFLEIFYGGKVFMLPECAIMNDSKKSVKTYSNTFCLFSQEPKPHIVWYHNYSCLVKGIQMVNVNTGRPFAITYYDGKSYQVTLTKYGKELNLSTDINDYKLNSISPINKLVMDVIETEDMEQIFDTKSKEHKIEKIKLLLEIEKQKVIILQQKIEIEKLKMNSINQEDKKALLDILAILQKN